MVGTTLRGKALSPLPMGNTLVGLALWVALLNITASDLSDTMCASTSVTNGMVSDGLPSARIKSCAAWMSASAEEISGIVKF